MDKSENHKIKWPEWMKSDLFIGLVIFALWLISAVFSFYVLLEFQQMILRRYVACCSDDRWGFQVFRQWSTMGIIGVWLGFVIITGEYHYQNQRKAKSWKMFKRAYIVLALMLLIAFIL